MPYYFYNFHTHIHTFIYISPLNCGQGYIKLSKKYKMMSNN